MNILIILIENIQYFQVVYFDSGEADDLVFYCSKNFHIHTSRVICLATQKVLFRKNHAFRCQCPCLQWSLPGKACQPTLELAYSVKNC